MYTNMYSYTVGSVPNSSAGMKFCGVGRSHSLVILSGGVSILLLHDPVKIIRH